MKLDADQKGNVTTGFRSARLPRSRRRILITLCLLVLVGGCKEYEQLETQYGRRRGRAAASVNGTRIDRRLLARSIYSN